MSTTQQSASPPPIPAPLPDGALDNLTGAVASFAGGGGTPAQLASTIVATTMQAAEVVFEPKITAALAPAHARLDALEASAGAAVAGNPILMEIVALLGRFFPHEVGTLRAMLEPSPPPPPARGA